MNFQVIVRNRATQDLRLQANYILVKVLRVLHGARDLEDVLLFLDEEV
jgi:plasmid stabilization system protein ParE